MVIKAISLRQPYASLVATGRKTLETRVWSTPYRGDLLICASLFGRQDPRGVALCVVRLVNIRPMVAEDAAAACIDLYPRALAWELTDLKPVRPVPVKGRLSLYDVEVPDDIFDV